MGRLNVALMLLALAACDNRSEFEKKLEKLDQELAASRTRALSDAMGRLDRQDADWEKSKGPAPHGKEACATAIGVLMSQDPRSMTKRELDESNFSVSYKRDDGTRWEYRCEVKSDRLRWQTVENGQAGRQRLEDDLRYTVADGIMTVTARGIDGKDYKYRFQMPSLRKL